MMKNNGTDLYHRFLQGDSDALETLVKKYSDSLVRFAYCYLRDSFAAEDAVEDAFAMLIVKHKRFEDEAHFRAYLYKVVRNKCFDRLRDRKRQIETIIHMVDPQMCVEMRERDRAVYDCMQQLPPQYRGALYLVYFEEFRPEEAAGLLNKTKKQTYNLLARAKAALKEILLKRGIGYEDI